MGDSPSGDVPERYDEIERTRDRAIREGLTVRAACKADHSGIRGRCCGYCGTYFRGDDMG